MKPSIGFDVASPHLERKLKSSIYGCMAPPLKTRVLGVSKDEDDDRMGRITNKSCYSRLAYTAIEMKVGRY